MNLTNIFFVVWLTGAIVHLFKIVMYMGEDNELNHDLAELVNMMPLLPWYMQIAMVLWIVVTVLIAALAWPIQLLVEVLRWAKRWSKQ